MLKGTKAVLSSRGLQSLKSEEPELLCLPIMGRFSLGKHLWRDWGRGKWQDPMNSADGEIEDLGSDPLKHSLLPFQSCPPDPKSYSETGQGSLQKGKPVQIARCGASCPFPSLHPPVAVSCSPPSQAPEADA